MNTIQRRHAIERLSQIAKRKREAARVEWAKTQRFFTGRSLQAALDAGLVMVRPDRLDDVIETHHSVGGALDILAWDKEAKASRDAYDTALATINTEEQRLKDEIMLGDAQEALALLRAFEAA